MSPMNTLSIFSCPKAWPDACPEAGPGLCAETGPEAEDFRMPLDLEVLLLDPLESLASSSASSLDLMIAVR